MYQLSPPDPGAYEKWADCLAEFGTGPLDGSGFDEPPELSKQAFSLYMDDRARCADTGIAPPEGWVHCNFYWIRDAEQELLGFLALRHSLTPPLLEVGGHIGYSVRPSARNSGVASAALELGLQQARTLDIKPVLLTVKEENLASRRVIELNGGAYADSRRGFRRYWFRLPGDQ